MRKTCHALVIGFTIVFRPLLGPPVTFAFWGLILMTAASAHPPDSPGSPHAAPNTPSGVDHVVAGSFAVEESCAESVSKLAVVSWNIERGVRQQKIAHALRHDLAADIYLLQEVDFHSRRSGFRPVAEDLARDLRMHYVFGVEFEELAQGRPGRPAFHGQAVLSRFPIVAVRVLRFRHQLHDWGPLWKPRWAWLQPRRGGRMALVVELQLGQQTLVVYNVHLESRASDAGRAKQIGEVLEDIRLHYSPETPVIVAGDLNTEKGRNSPVLRELRAARFHDALSNHKGRVRTKVGSNGRPDWIFLRRLRSFDAGVRELAISDHFPLTARIAWPPAALASSPDGRPVRP